MPVYAYTAINAKGRTIRGTMVAENEVDLEIRLKEMELDVTDSREKKERKAGLISRIKLKDMIILCLHLEQLTRAGVPIHEALADVRDSTESPKLRDIMTDILEKVKSGSKLSAALDTYPRVFDKVFVGLVQAGEKNGNLTESFVHMSEHMKWVNDIRRKVKKAMAYPIALLAMMSGVISILMIAVVPKLIRFILDQGFEVPFHTRALIAVSGAFQNYWFLIFGIPAIVFLVTLTIYRNHEPFAYWIDARLIRLPVFGEVIRKINMARFVHFFSVMFKSGIDIPEALTVARGVVGNRVIKESIDLVNRSVIEGNNLTSSLRISSQFPALVIRMFKVGEDSGNMSEALENINFFYHREVNDSVDSLVGIVQPALTIIMGGLIFWVIAAVFGPLYQSFSQMKY
jgi:type IV pilus assembly protein PilC